MKKHILFISLIFFSITLSFGQSFTLSNEHGDLPNGAIINYTGDIASTIYAEIDVTNNSDEAKDVLVKKVYIEIVDGSDNMFCWGGSCYGPGIFVSPNHSTIEAGATNTEFSGDYFANNTEGISTLMYIWYDMNDTTDSVYVIVNFNTKMTKKLELAGPEGNIISNGSLIYEGGLDLVEADLIRVINFGNEVIDVKVKKTINEGDTIAGTQNNFYWDMEYSMDQYESDAVSMASLETFYDFKGMYHPDGNEGSSIITYEFFDINNTSNSVTVEVEYDAESSQGIADKISLADFSYAYPNPAANQVSFTYDLSNEVNDAAIIISNLLGSVVKERRIYKNNNSVTIETRDLRDGLYLYSLKINGKIEFTRKLVVKH